MERRVSLIVVGTLLQIVFLHLCRRYVAVVYLQLAVLLLIEDMIIVEQGLHFHYRFIREIVATISWILVDWNIAILCEFEDISKQIKLFPLRFHREIKARIGIIIQIDFAIDITAPHHFFRHLYCRWECELGPHRHGRGRALLLLLLCWLDSASLGLSHNRARHQHYHCQEQKLLHIFII